MRIFFLKLLLLIAPLALTLGYVEHRFSEMNTHYYTKRQSLERQLDTIEILVMGSSNSYYGIDPGRFSYPGYNLGFNNQGAYYDKMLLMKYLDRMPNLKVVVLPAIYLQMGHYIPATSQAWRMWFYRQFFDIPLETNDGKWCDWGYLLEPKNFSKIALFGDQSYRYIRDDFQTVIDIVPQENGWYNAGVDGSAAADLSKNVGPTAAEAHNQTSDPAIYARSLGYWGDIVEALRQRDIATVIVQLPVHPSYYEHLDKAKFSLLQKMLGAFADKNGLTYVDYTKDPRFVTEDYMSIIDHLNGRGAEKFSAIFDREVLVPLMAKRFKAKMAVHSAQ